MKRQVSPVDVPRNRDIADRLEPGLVERLDDIFDEILEARWGQIFLGVAEQELKRLILALGIKRGNLLIGD
jgi:hypothetical protein